MIFINSVHHSRQPGHPHSQEQRQRRLQRQRRQLGFTVLIDVIIQEYIVV